jgi:serine phosphatase RsbU (regulator of sigma subunit)
VLGRQIPALDLPVPDWSRPIILALLILTLAMGTRAFLSTRRARALERTQSAMEGDLLVMQSALVPEVPALLGGLAISASYRPAEGPAAGGDFYDVIALSDGRVAMLLGDVSGHGHAALKQAALTRYTLRAYLEAGLEPGAALRLAGEVLSDPNFEHFATVIAGIYDERTATLSYGSSGHPPPLTPNIPGPEVLGGFSAPPLGWGVPTGQRQTVLTLCAGARVCFFSDGLIEARTNDGLLGREGLLELLQNLGAEEGAADLLAAVRQSATRINDDMAACIIQQSATSSTLGSARFEELEIDQAALSDSGPDRFLEACGLEQEQRMAALAQAREMLGRSPSVRLRVRVDPGLEPFAQIVPSSRHILELEEHLHLTSARVSA